MKIEVDTHDEPTHLRALVVMLEAIAGKPGIPASQPIPEYMWARVANGGAATDLAPLPEPAAAEAFALTPPPVVLDVPPTAAPAAVIPPPPPPAADGAEELDSAGHAWNADIHASSKAKVADGTWRKRRGGPSETAEAAAPVAPPAPPAPSAPPAPPATVAEAGAADDDTLFGLVCAWVQSHDNATIELSPFAPGLVSLYGALADGMVVRPSGNWFIADWPAGKPCS